MPLEDDFPQDPTKPSLQYALSTQQPLALPWNNEAVPIGTALKKMAIKYSETPAPGSAKFELSKVLAFDKDSLNATPLLYCDLHAGTCSDASVAGSSSAHSDLATDFTGSIGGSFIGGSARGTFSQNSSRDEGADKASVQTIFRAGKVTLAHFPRLSSDALRILRTAPDPSRTFSEAFGDYFVGGYILGGTNSTIVWGQGASERSASRLDATYEVHALFLSYEDEYHSASEDSASVGQASLTAFDSLENYQAAFEAHDYAGFRRALQASSDNRSRGSKIQGRARKKLRDLGLGLTPPSDWFWNYYSSRGMDFGSTVAL
ncbi:hypothetical protein LIA77_07817 [Sarocladium implicatum]|nr:hypothetical protein LIA77_07817 [Sarocladium implicatum]